MSISADLLTVYQEHAHLGKQCCRLIGLSFCVGAGLSAGASDQLFQHLLQAREDASIQPDEDAMIIMANGELLAQRSEST